MARFQNKITGVVVSVDDSKADRFGPEWKALADGETPSASKKGKRSGPPTVDEILADVGTDQELAQAALEAEQAKGDKARSSLVEKLEAILAAGDGDSED